MGKSEQRILRRFEVTGRGLVLESSEPSRAGNLLRFFARKSSVTVLVGCTYIWWLGCQGSCLRPSFSAFLIGLGAEHQVLDIPAEWGTDGQTSYVRLKRTQLGSCDIWRGTCPSCQSTERGIYPVRKSFSLWRERWSNSDRKKRERLRSRIQNCST